MILITRQLTALKNMQKIIRHLLLYIFFLVLPNVVSGQNITAQLLKERIQEAINRPMPTPLEMIGDEILLAPAPVLVIGYLDTLNTTETKANADWGAVLGWFLMEAANGAWRDLAVVPSYQFNSDAATQFRDVTATRRYTLARVAARTGASYGLTGSVRVQNGQFDLTLELLEFPGGRTLDSRKQSGAMADLPGETYQLADTLLGKINGRGDSFQANNMLAPKLAELAALLDAYTQTLNLNNSKSLAVYEKLWRDHRQSLPLSAAYLVELASYGKAAKIREDLPGLTISTGNVGTMEVYAQLLRSRNTPTGIDADAVARLTKALALNPNNISAWLALSNAYSGEQVMYQEDIRGMRSVISPAIDHHLGHASAVSVALEAVERWPNHYRTWWALSYALQNYAGLVRGTAYWKNVPEESRIRYSAIMQIADDCLSKALARHPEQGYLYEMKIDLDSHAGRNWMTSFQRAAELIPHSRSLYQTAFNYARPQWGGTRDDMREIYKTALENNPDANWPTELRDAWASEIKPWIDFSRLWVRICAAVLLPLALVWAWRIWKTAKRSR